MRAELEPLGIRVSEVYPGLTATEFAQAAQEYLAVGSSRRFGRGGQSPEAVARAIAHSVQDYVEEVYPFQERAR
jgi:short-subunit dehydrogenase